MSDIEQEVDIILSDLLHHLLGLGNGARESVPVGRFDVDPQPPVGGMSRNLSLSARLHLCLLRKQIPIFNRHAGMMVDGANRKLRRQVDRR